MTLVAPPAARLGATLAEIGTPSLLIELDAFEANVRGMAEFTASCGVALRPHAKAHKSVDIARRQVAAGAVGVCCQKLSEAYPFAAAGIESIHVSNEFVGADKVAMAVELAAHTRLSVCVDSLPQVAVLGLAAAEAGVRIDVLPEIDVGQRRCGVTRPDDLLRLVDAIAQHAALRFGGIQAYHGGAQHIASWQARGEAAKLAAQRASEFVSVLRARGVDVPVVTGGGTGTVEFDARSGVYTEVQPGSYVFGDGDYGSIEWTALDRPRQSLFILSTIMSATRPGMAVCDVGLKGLAVDSGLPREVTALSRVETPELAYVGANDEHGMLDVAGGLERGTESLVGQRVLIVPGHCDPTVNLYDEFVCVRAAQVEALWKVDARGLSR
ncbi:MULTISPECIES: DSD1 family PLP-dependent enzyme [unclassified Caballeronia]|uniref:DSD1 family PLP-dependent enzyme n=1 Tax=unclassified Caballeronia TaxID=2646786 RepID=UPI00285F4068|nr:MULTISPECIES: DSD1 family PLP-dependent enzyme [unclassified Caballeronia]MDR5752844.1 DSD1 family PLP-dependent enzyme [Caballeronia sp. LZ024]MDR5841488.1 DSD1 family PLP-dependent enzyme [Caballeronia sp. LZ031]